MNRQKKAAGFIFIGVFIGLILGIGYTVKASFVNDNSFAKNFFAAANQKEEAPIVIRKSITAPVAIEPDESFISAELMAEFLYTVGENLSANLSFLTDGWHDGIAMLSYTMADMTGTGDMIQDRLAQGISAFATRLHADAEVAADTIRGVSGFFGEVQENHVVNFEDMFESYRSAALALRVATSRVAMLELHPLASIANSFVEPSIPENLLADTLKIQLNLTSEGKIEAPVIKVPVNLNANGTIEVATTTVVVAPLKIQLNLTQQGTIESPNQVAIPVVVPPVANPSDNTGSGIVNNYIQSTVVDNAQLDALSTKLTNLQNQVNSMILTNSQSNISIFQTIAQSSPSASFVTDLLTDANIPNDITVSGYLPTSGGTISGNLTVTGTCTGCGSGGSGTPGGLDTQLQFNSSGSFAGNSGLAYSSTNLLLGGNLAVNGGTVNFGTGSATTTLTAANGNFGIGSTSPSVALSVKGAVSIGDLLTASFINATSTTATSTFAAGIAATRFNATSGTSTFANGIELTAGCVKMPSGSCLNFAGSGGAGTPGGNTTQVQYNNGGSFDGRSLFTFDNSTGNVLIGGDLAVSGGDVTLGNGLIATTTLHGEYGKFGIGTTSPYGQFSIEATTIAGSSTPIFVIGDSGTSTIFGVNWAGVVGIGTATPGGAEELTGIGLSIATSTYVSGGFAVGASATTSSGAVLANFLASNGRMQVKELVSCDTIDTDANGILKCGSDSGAGGAGGWVEAGTEVRLTTGTDSVILNTLNVIGNTISIGNGLVASSTVSGSYGRLGIGTTSPYAQLAVESVQGVVGSTTPIFAIGDSGTTSQFLGINWAGVVGIGTNTDSGAESLNGIGFAVATDTLVGGSLTIVGNVDIQGTCTGCGSGGTPGGNTTQVQYNNGGSFDGRSLFTFDNSTGNVVIGGDIAVGGGDITLGNGLIATTTFHGEYGKLGIGTTSPYAQFSFEATSIAGSSTPIFVIGDTGSSTLFGINWAGVVGIATATDSGPENLSGIGFSVATSTYVSGGFAVGASATTSSGALLANFLAANGRIQVKELVSCDTIDTDASGILKCGSDSGAGGAGGWNEVGTEVRLTTGTNSVIVPNLSIVSNTLNIGNGLTATATLSGNYGRLGFGSTTPYAQYSFEATAGIASTTNPIFVIGDAGTSTIFGINWAGVIGIGTATQSGPEELNGIGFAIATDTLVGGSLTIVGNVDIQGTCTGCGGGASVAGSSGDVQFNSGGSMAGDSGLQYAAGVLGVSSTLNLGGASAQGTLSLGTGATATSTLSGNYGRLGFGTTSPYAQVSIEAVQGVVGSSTPIFTVSDSGTSTPLLQVSGVTGYTGIGTSSPWGRLSVEILDVSDYKTPSFVVGDYGTATPALAVYSNGITTIDQLQTGAVSFDTNAGMVSWVDLPITAGAAQGTVESYTAQIDGTDLFTIYSTSDGKGGINATGVGVATTTPGGTFAIAGATSTPALLVAQTGTGDYLHVGASHYLVVTNGGSLGLSTSTPGATLGVNGNTVLNGNLSLTSSGVLDVQGTGTSTFEGGVAATRFNATSGTSTFANGIELTAGCVKMPSGTCLNFAGSGGAGTPGGADTQVQFNSSNSFAGNSGLIYSSTNLGIGGTLSVNGGTLSLGNGLTATTSFSGQYGRLGVGTTSPYGQFSIEATSVAGSSTPIFVVGDSGTATPMFVINGVSGYAGIGTATPWGRLSVEILDQGDESIPSFAVGDYGTATPALAVYSSGVTTIDQLQTGALTFDSDAGQVPWFDMPVTSSAVQGTAEGYIAQIDSNTLLSIYATSDGKGGINASGVGVATSTPGGTFSVHAATNTPALLVNQTSYGDLFHFQQQGLPAFVGKSTGNIGIASSTPTSILSIATSSATSALLINQTGAGDVMHLTNAGTHILVVKSTGRIGIGTSSPQAVLGIDNTNSNTVPALMIKAGGSGDGNIAIAVDADDVCRDASDAGALCALNDLAELFPISENVDAGDIVIADPNNPGKIKKAEAGNRDKLVGVISTSPAIVFEGSGLKALGGIYQRTGQTAPLALSGRVPVKVNLEGGAIHIGDPITISSVNGVGKKATDTGLIVGYSMQNLETATTTAGAVDQVTMLSNLGYFYAPAEQQPLIASLLAQVIEAVSSWLNSVVVNIKEIISNKVTTQQLCVGQTCVNEDQLKALLQAVPTPAPQPNPPVPEPEPEVTPPSEPTPEPEAPPVEPPPANE